MPRSRLNALMGCAAAALSWSQGALAQTPGDDTHAEARADETLKQMTPDEKLVLVKGTMGLGIMGFMPPAEAAGGSGFVPGIPRLEVPPLNETDASLGVAYLMGLRGKAGPSTPLPSGMAMGASWNPDLLFRAGAMIGAEARAKGFNVLLAGGANLIRDPRNGRTFEYLGEDPLHTGVLVGAAIAGIQSNHIISTIKHFALNDQETARFSIDARIAEPAARESDLLAFQIGIERGRPGAVMCAYNKVNGQKACANDWLLNTVLKRDWRYKGFVLSDWGAVPGVFAALGGLDQQSAAIIDKAQYFGEPLATAAREKPEYAARLNDMNRRVLTSIYAGGLDRFPTKPGGAIDLAADLAVSEQVAKQGIVLLRNRGAALPLAVGAKRIALIGGFSDRGVLSGGGSSQVHLEGGPAALIPMKSGGPIPDMISEQYQRSSPMAAIHARSPNTAVVYSDGRYVSEAVMQAKLADVVIVFATQWTTEGIDQPDLSLPGNQDALIAAVTAANPHTIVVLETGGPVLMPWLDKTAAVLEAWYSGGRGGEAIASVLFGDTNPSGHLPVTFPASLDRLPRPELDGLAAAAMSFDVMTAQESNLSVNYDIEGSDVGYRWNARRDQKALFPFGYGLSYSTFDTRDLRVKGLTASFTVRNSGKRDGDTVGQVYLAARDGAVKQRLVGFQRVSLPAGAEKTVSVTIDPRLLADWKDGAWVMPRGTYQFALGDDAEHLGARVSVKMAARRWRD